MKNPKILYHGSPQSGIKKFIPRKPNDAGDNPDNKHEGVYASSNKREAMIMGIIAGVKGLSSIDYGKKIMGIIYEGKITKKYFYLYHFGSKDFENIPKGSTQFISKKEFTPIKTEKFKIDDYKNLIRKPTKEELKRVNKILNQNKISLRKYKKSDLNQQINLLLKNKIYKTKSNANKSEKPWIEKALKNYKKEKPDFYVLAITLNKRQIGNIVAENIDYKNKKLEIGFWIVKDSWGQGITTKALELFLKKIKKKFPKFTIYAKHKKSNIASSKVLSKCDFEKIGIKDNLVVRRLK